MSDSLWPHEPQHTRPPCPSPIPGVHPIPSPLSRWCHPTISSSIIAFFSCPRSFPESGSFPMSQLFPSGGQSIGVSASTSVLPMNTQDWSPLGWTGWISLQSNFCKKPLLLHITTKITETFPPPGCWKIPWGNSRNLISPLLGNNFCLLRAGAILLWLFQSSSANCVFLLYVRN